MFPLQRGRMLVEMAKRKASSPICSNTKKKTKCNTDCSLQDISLSSSMLETDPDFSFDFGSEVEFDVSSILARPQEDSTNEMHDTNPEPSGHSSSMQYVDDLKGDKIDEPFLDKEINRDGQDPSSPIDFFNPHKINTFSIHETMAILLNQDDIDSGNILISPSSVISSTASAIDHTAPSTDNCASVIDYTASSTDNCASAIDHTASSTDNCASAIDHTASSTDNCASAIDYTASSTDNCASVIDYTASSTDNCASAIDYTASSTDNCASAIDHTASSTDNCASVIDYTASSTDNCASAIDYTASSTDNCASAIDHTASSTDNCASAIDYTASSTDNCVSAIDHTVSSTDKCASAIDYTASSTDNCASAIDHTASSTDNCASAIDHTASSTDNCVSVIDHTASTSSHTCYMEFTASTPGHITTISHTVSTSSLNMDILESASPIHSPIDTTEAADNVYPNDIPTILLENSSGQTLEPTADQIVYRKMDSKQKRVKGEEYVGRRLNAETGKYTLIEKAAKYVKERCNCKGRGTKCNDITEEQRQHVHDVFWTNLVTWFERKVLVNAIVDVHSTNTAEKKRRVMKYHLKIDGVRKAVCSTMFLNTLNLTDWTVRDWCSNEVQRLEKTRSCHYDRNLISKNHCTEEFLDKLNTMPSHYCRKDTEKNYVERCFRSYEDLHTLYRKVCEEDNIAALDIKTFKFLFNNHPKKLSLFHPRKDQCDTCVEYEKGNLDIMIWNEHRAKYKCAQEEKARDKKEREPGTLLISMDLQAVLLSPSLQASALYYRTKLTVHNFTIFDLGTADVDCYVWNEVEGGLTANEFSSCLHNYLTLKLASGSFTKCIIYSDGCTYQNRNKTMAKMLSLFSRTHGIVIEQKYLEKGHTQMECDSVHATVEKNLKKNGRSLEIYSPSDYLKIIKEARKGQNPYKVHYLTFDFFHAFDEVTSLSSLRPGKTVGDPTVVDLRAIRYCEDGEIKYKLNHSENWVSLPRSRNDGRQETNVTPKALYNAPRKITKDKYNHLQQMKSVLPKDVHSFYDNLPH